MSRQFLSDGHQCNTGCPYAYTSQASGYRVETHMVRCLFCVRHGMGRFVVFTKSPVANPWGAIGVDPREYVCRTYIS